MASVLARSTRLVCRRQIHHTATTSQGGWLTGLFKDKTQPPTVTQTQEPTTAINQTLVVSPSLVPDASTPKAKKSPKKKALSPEAKKLRFQENIDFMTSRLAKQPKAPLPKISKTTWIRTLAVCQTEEELKQVMELLPTWKPWKEMRARFNEPLSEAFILRCIVLNKPEIAVEVFGNYAKYNLSLTLSGARKLLQATYEAHPLILPITISSFFRVYRLPSISKDLPCCSMLLSACLKDGSKEAMVIAESLIGSLKLLLTTKEPQPILQTREKGDDMPRVWTKWALRKIEESLSGREGDSEDVAWLHSWRERSGHVASA
ncbi:hypothetical protein AGABI2DRAFT_194635 [Agaricus bisporus var. bisporus H97]|uniref:hypothetical protein n=1 Tax=Agaricus bisporus var. bisporus (strain H97 / ATCC MYA-4626 / FGSC 10389) TaxID=936046 RepID=UPI00029F5290|nr:hypothetical protein AGABI2DRAFT_194635 [Agaricus bisporus var. bisporus H97]EKV44710.1 hypothetical protein AGABI2DRAFT_194635 [Agaricus bisporus var. bisporus H97]